MTEPIAPLTEYLTPKQVAALMPEVLTVAGLAQMRFKGNGPKYLKPTGGKAFYRKQDIIDWLEASERTSTFEK